MHILHQDLRFAIGSWEQDRFRNEKSQAYAATTRFPTVAGQGGFTRQQPEPRIIIVRKYREHMGICSFALLQTGLTKAEPAGWARTISCHLTRTSLSHPDVDLSCCDS